MSLLKFGHKFFVTLIILLVIVSIVGLIKVVAVYFDVFRFPLGSSHEVWGQFGDYLGGVMNPIFGFLGLVAILITIILQIRQLDISDRELKTSNEELKLTREELSKSAEAMQKQAIYYKQQMNREDLYRLISKLIDRVNNNFNKEELFIYGKTSVTMSGVFFDGTNVNENGRMKTLYEEASNKNSRTFKVIRYIESDLLRLSDLVHNYESITNNETEKSPLLKFYKYEFGMIVGGLYQYGLVSEKLAMQYSD